MADKLNLHQKIAAIMREVGTLEKGGFNANQKYAFIQHQDVVNLLRPLLAKHGLIVWQSVKDWVVSPTDPRMKTITYEYRLVDVDTGETTPTALVLADAFDSGDKGPNKGSTTADKFYLLRTFALGAGTHEDSEADEETDKAARISAAAQTPRITRGSAPGVQRGGKSDVATAAQVTAVAKEVKRLNLDAKTFLPVLEATIGKGPAEGVSLRDFLSDLTSAEIGSLITNLADFGPAPEITSAPIQDTLAVV